MKSTCCSEGARLQSVNREAANHPLHSTPYSIYEFMTQENQYTNSNFYSHITPNSLFKTSPT